MLNSFVRKNEFLEKYFYSIKFLTLWVSVLVLFHTYTSKVFNLVILTILTCIGGLYISFVYPGYYSFRFLSYTIKVDTLAHLLMGEMFHLILFLFIFNYYNKAYHIISYQTINSILLIIVYLLIVDIENVYNLRKHDIQNIITLVFITLIIYEIMRYTLIKKIENI